jgi:hypothetical protein
MKRFFNVTVLALAVNFLVLAGGVAYLRLTDHLDREKVFAIKDILFPPPPAPAPSTQPADPTTQPILKLEELLAQQSGHTASEQVEFIQHTFDAQMAQLDRRQRELADLQRQVELAKQQIGRDRTALDEQRKEVATREQEASKLATDKGFQDCLALYRSMPGKQVKTIFMSLDEKMVGQYLSAMEPRAAARIVKEFKSPEETQFIQKVLERIRQQQPAAQPTQPQAQQASAAGAP